LDLPGWQKLYSELKDRNFEIVSVSQDTGGVKDAGKWIEAAKPEFTVLIDTQHLVTRLYNMVNVPPSGSTGVGASCGPTKSLTLTLASRLSMGSTPVSI
jgi:alkyl hydroperoxide reductase subunit AhpC